MKRMITEHEEDHQSQTSSPLLEIRNIHPNLDLPFFSWLSNCVRMDCSIVNPPSRSDASFSGSFLWMVIISRPCRGGGDEE